MFRPTLANPGQKRTIQPKYAQTQATTYAGFLDPNFDRSFDIYPGSVMCRLGGELFTPYKGTGNQRPFGLSALFCAPTLGIDEVTGTGANNFTVWVGDSEATFVIFAPAFDQTANWNSYNPSDGGRTLLTGTNKGLLTPTGADNTNAVAELMDVYGTDKILVRLNRFHFASGAVAGS